MSDVRWQGWSCPNKEKARERLKMSCASDRGDTDGGNGWGG